MTAGTHRQKKKSKSGHSIAPMPACRMSFDMTGLEAVSLENAPKRWSSERCRNCLAKVVGALKVSCGARGDCFLMLLIRHRRGRRRSKGKRSENAGHKEKVPPLHVSMSACMLLVGKLLQRSTTCA